MTMLAAADATGSIEVGCGGTEVFFVDAIGNETTPAGAVRVEVVTDGPDGTPMIMAFSRHPSAVELRAA